MTRRLVQGSAALLVAAALGGGCVSKSKPANGMSQVSADRLEAIRGSYKSAFPNASVGTVTAVLDDKPYAMVGEIDTTGLREGQVISFLDASEKVIANGKIVKIDAAGVAVMFDAGARRPMTGDVAVKF